ncbi:Alkaline phosphatase synthesis sensor protein PhoR [compost metagenome]
MKVNLRLIFRLAVHTTISLILLFLSVSAGLFLITELLLPNEGDKQELAILINIFVVFIAFVIVYGWYIGRPIFYIIGRVNRLAEGIYVEPDKYLKIYTKNEMKLKRSYALFTELIIQLDTLANELESSKKERSRLDTMQKEWIAGISHDLKTPLTYIKGYSSMLISPQYEWNSEEKIKFASEILLKADHMEELIGDLNLSFSLDGQKLPLKMEKYNLVEFVRRIVADAVNDPRAEGFNLSFETDTPSAETMLDVKLLQRALHNLLINAILHNSVGTNIQVRIIKTTVLSIMITDDGTGISKQDIGRLFNKYYRGTTTDSQSEGTGLGMAIAHQLVLAHGGTIDVTSQINEGTTIAITLPIII